MGIIGVEVEKNESSEKFVKETNDRLNGSLPIGNVINGYAYLLQKGKQTIVVFSLNPFFFLADWLIFHFPLATWLIYFAFKRGLRKAGYTEKTKLVSRGKLLELMAEVCKSGKKGSTRVS